jgi:hypothetical protein
VDPLAGTQVRGAVVAAALIALAACGAPQPPRVSVARYAGAPSARDPAASDPEAITELAVRAAVDDNDFARP